MSDNEYECVCVRLLLALGPELCSKVHLQNLPHLVDGSYPHTISLCCTDKSLLTGFHGERQVVTNKQNMVECVVRSCFYSCEWFVCLSMQMLLKLQVQHMTKCNNVSGLK